MSGTKRTSLHNFNLDETISSIIIDHLSGLFKKGYFNYVTLPHWFFVKKFKQVWSDVRSNGIIWTTANQHLSLNVLNTSCTWYVWFIPVRLHASTFQVASSEYNRHTNHWVFNSFSITTPAELMHFMYNFVEHNWGHTPWIQLGQCKARPFNFHRVCFFLSSFSTPTHLWASALCSSSTGHRQHLLANVTYIVYFN